LNVLKEELISISIVVHNQAPIAEGLLDDISNLGDRLPAEVIFTVNTDEPLSFKPQDHYHPVTIIRNENPKGFGANHNFAFKKSKGRYFCVLNPDIRFVGNPFEPLIACISDTNAGVVAPRIINPTGEIENSARRFPTPFSILKKALAGSTALDYPHMGLVFQPDWVGGMFMLFSSDIFETVQGFDERYFLYYEDVDLCARLRLAKIPVLLCPQAEAVHDARYDSHHNATYRQWHLKSMLRFFTSSGYWKLVIAARVKG
jgi:GT2 family glycosyltransferase